MLGQQHGSYGLLGAVWEATRKFHAIPTLWSLLELQSTGLTPAPRARGGVQTPLGGLRCRVLVLGQQHGSYGLLGAVWEATCKFHTIPTPL